LKAQVNVQVKVYVQGRVQEQQWVQVVASQVFDSRDGDRAREARNGTTCRAVVRRDTRVEVGMGKQTSRPGAL
jgi:hypothetical protein